MATNFGPEVTQAPEVQSFTTVKEGVVREPTFLQGLGDIFDQAGTILESRKKARQDATVANFVRDQVLVADALEQGAPGMTQAAARARLRKNFLQYLEANPGLSEELIAAQRSVIGTPGLGKIVDEGTKEQQRLNARADQLVTAGLLPASHTEQQFKDADEAARIAVAAQERYDERINTLTLRQKELTVGTAEYEANQRQISEENRKYFQDTQPVRFQQVKSQFEDILNGSGSEAEKQKAIEDFFVAELSKASAQLGTLSAQESKFLLLPFEQMRDDYLARVRGELEDAELERNITRIEQASQLMLLQDPEVANAVAATKMFGDSALVGSMLQNTGVFNKVSKLIAGNSGNTKEETPSLYSTESTQKQAVKTYVEGVTRGLSSSDEDTRKEAESHTKKILESLVDDEGKIRRDPKAAFQPVKWISSNEFLVAMRANPKAFEEDLDDVRTVLEAHYADEVWGMVKREFKESNVITPGEVTGFTVGVMGGASPIKGDATVTPTPDAVSYRSTSSGMEFFAVDSENLRAITKARELNKSLKPIINETVKAFSHMDGRSDYGQYWSETSDTIMNVTGQGSDKVEGGEAEDDLSLRDFNEPETLVPEAEPLLRLIDSTETGGTADYDTLLGFSQNNKFSDVKVSNMTLDEVISFQQGPEYRSFSKDKVGRVATPVGRYQIVGKTLRALKDKLGLTGSEKFDASLQDRLFNELLQGRLRRAGGNVDKAVSELRNEWEGLNHVKTSQLKSALEGLVAAGG